MRRYKTHCGGGKVVYKDKTKKYMLGGLGDALGGIMGGAGGGAGAAGGGLPGMLMGLLNKPKDQQAQVGAPPAMRKGGKKRKSLTGLGYQEGGEMFEEFKRSMTKEGTPLLEGPVTEPNEEEDEAIQRLMEAAGSPERLLQLIELVKEDILGEGMDEDMEDAEDLTMMEEDEEDIEEEEFQFGGMYGKGQSPYYESDYSEIYEELDELSKPDPSTKYKEEPMFRRGGLLNI